MAGNSECKRVGICHELPVVPKQLLPWGAWLDLRGQLRQGTGFNWKSRKLFTSLKLSTCCHALLGWGVSKGKEKKAKTRRSNTPMVEEDMSLLSEEEPVDTCGELGPTNLWHKERDFCTPPVDGVPWQQKRCRLGGVTRAQLHLGSTEQLRSCWLASLFVLCHCDAWVPLPAGSCELCQLLSAQAHGRSFRSRARVHKVDCPVILGKCHFCALSLMFC